MSFDRKIRPERCPICKSPARVSYLLSGNMTVLCRNAGCKLSVQEDNKSSITERIAINKWNERVATILAEAVC